MEEYITTIVIAGNGMVTPTYIKLGNRSTAERNKLNFVLPNGVTSPSALNQALFKHESGKLYTVDGVYNEPNTISIIVPVGVQSNPGYYTVQLKVSSETGEETFFSNLVKCFVQGDNFGATSALASGEINTIQSPTFAYLTVKAGVLYTSSDGTDWEPVIEPYIISTISNISVDAIYEYGQLLIIDMENGTWGIKIGDGVTTFEHLIWIVIPDVTDDKMYLRSNGKWVTSEKLVQISDDGYWIVGGVKTTTKVIQPTFEIGTVTDGPTAQVTLGGTPSDVTFNFVLPRGLDSDTKVGLLSALKTTAKGTIVDAVNELHDEVEAFANPSWSEVTDKPGIVATLDIIVNPTNPGVPAAGRTTLWIEGSMSIDV